MLAQLGVGQRERIHEGLGHHRQTAVHVVGLLHDVVGLHPEAQGQTGHKALEVKGQASQAYIQALPGLHSIPSRHVGMIILASQFIFTEKAIKITM